MISPRGLYEHEETLFVWNEVGNADSYEIEVVDSETSELMISTVVEGNRFIPSEELAPGSYQWRIAGRLQGGRGDRTEWMPFERIRSTWSTRR